VSETEAAPKLARGVRLRALDDGKSVLLIPEGVVTLNATAAAALGLVDGTRTVGQIISELRRRFAAPGDSIDADVADLFGRLQQRGLVFFSSAQPPR
jgi:pyrroloquinoline quinone biosynthesis protein D